MAFAARVQSTLNRIAPDLQRHAVVFADIRKVAVPRLPYRTFDRGDDARIEVVAVLHISRDPSIWRGRA